jgi:hypothetical protein
MDFSGSMEASSKRTKSRRTLTSSCSFGDRRPLPVLQSWAKHLQANLAVFSRAQVKATFHVDFMAVDLQGTPEVLVDLTRYYTGMFSHRRPDFLWKGSV